MIPMNRRFLLSKKEDYWKIIKTDINERKPVKRTRKLSEEWNDLKVSYPEVATYFPETLEDLVKADYDKLVAIYLRYKQKFEPFLTGMADVNRAKQIDSAIRETFNYDKLKKNDIKKFFKDNSDRLHIHACFYCECVPIFPYDDKKVSQWDLDHVLDKADCPLLCYSLFNFVPSCKNCNSTCKGTRVLGGLYNKKWKLLGYEKLRMIRLSPSARGYSFKNNVSIDVQPENIGMGSFLKYQNKYSIVFHTLNNFDDFVRLFKLDKKYNASDILRPALEYLDKRRKLPEKYKQQIAHAVSVTMDELDEEIYPKEEHRHLLKTLYENLRTFNLTYPKIK